MQVFPKHFFRDSWLQEYDSQGPGTDKPELEWRLILPNTLYTDFGVLHHLTLHKCSALHLYMVNTAV